MQTLFSLLLALAPGFTPDATVEPVPVDKPFTWELDNVSNNCETRFEPSVDSKGGFSLSFHDSDLKVDADKRIDYLSCKISWKPLIPSNKRLRSAELSVAGSFDSSDRAKGQLRLGHKMLGTGSSPSLSSYDLEDGKFSYKIELQNIEDDNCGKEVKLISTFSLILNRDKVWKVDSESADPSLSLNQVHLSHVEWEDCPTGSVD